MFHWKFFRDTGSRLVHFTGRETEARKTEGMGINSCPAHSLNQSPVAEQGVSSPAPCPSCYGTFSGRGLGPHGLHRGHSLRECSAQTESSGEKRLGAFIERLRVSKARNFPLHKREKPEAHREGQAGSRGEQEGGTQAGRLQARRMPAGATSFSEESDAGACSGLKMKRTSKIPDPNPWTF